MSLAKVAIPEPAQLEAAYALNGPGGGAPSVSLPFVVAYARVSTQEQKHGRTIQSQLDWVQEEIEGRDDVNVAVFVDDGVSGSNNDREGLRRVLRLLTAGFVSELWVNTIDRLCRADEMGSWGEILDPLRDLGVTIRTEERGFDCHRDKDWADLRDEANEAAKDRVRTQKRFRRGMRARARRDMKPSYTDPPGLTWLREELRWEIHAEEAAGLRRAADALISGRSIRETEELLEEEGHVRKSGSSWRKTDIHAAFRAETISGTWHIKVPSLQLKAPSKHYRIAVPQIISEAKRRSVLQALEGRRRHHSRPWSLPVLLRHLAYCGLCGARLRVERSRKDGPTRFRCRRCGKALGRWPTSAVDEAVWSRIVAVLRAPAIVEAGARMPEGAHVDPVGLQAAEVERARRELAGLKRRAQELNRRFLCGALPQDEYDGIKPEIDSRVHEAERQVQEGQDALRRLQLRQRDARAEQARRTGFLEGLGQLTFDERRRIVELFLKGTRGWGLELYPDGHHVLRGALPTSEGLPRIVNLAGGES